MGDGTSQFYAGGTNPAGGERTQVGEGGWAGIAAGWAGIAAIG